MLLTCHPRLMGNLRKLVHTHHNTIKKVLLRLTGPAQLHTPLCRSGTPIDGVDLMRHHHVHHYRNRGRKLRQRHKFP